MKRAFSSRRQLARATRFISNSIEPLESRQLMAITFEPPTTTLIDPGTPQPTHVVEGTPGNDVINVSFRDDPYIGRRLTVQRNSEPAYIVTLATNENVRIKGLE